MILNNAETEFVAILVEQFFHKRSVCDAQEAVEDTCKSNEWLDDTAGELWAELERRGFLEPIA